MKFSCLIRGAFSFSQEHREHELGRNISCFDFNVARHGWPSCYYRSGSSGVCMMNEAWKNEQQPSFLSFISSFLRETSFRMNSVPINPDLIFNCGGLSVAFVFVTTWDGHNTSAVFSRIQKVAKEFAYLYVVMALRSKDHNDSFVHSYFKFEVEIGRPTFMPVLDPEMGFEKIVKIALALGACKQQDAIMKLKAERRQLMQRTDLFIGILTSIPGIDPHDANSLRQAIGSVEAIARASWETILEKTDLSPEKAIAIQRFFRDPKHYLTPKLT